MRLYKMYNQKRKIFFMLQRIISILMVFWLLSSTNLYAQKGPDPEIRKLKVEYVTGKMSLTEHQKVKFTPLYHKFSDELLVHRRAIRELEKSSDSESAVQERQKLEEKIVEIKGRYKNKFLEIISSQQLESMYRAETEFKKMLIDKLRK